MRVRTTIWTVSFWLLLGGCGGAQADTSGDSSSRGGETSGAGGQAPAGPVSDSGSTEVRAVVGRAGGTLSLGNLSRFEISDGALAEPVEITFANGAEGQAFGDRENQRALGPMLTIQPGLTAADGDFTVSIPQQPLPNGWSDGDLALAVEEVDEEQRAINTLGTQTRWQFFPARVQNGRFTATLRTIPGHRVQFGVAR